MPRKRQTEVCPPDIFKQTFHNSDAGTAFKLFAGKVPEAGKTSTVVVAADSCANMTDVCEPFRGQYRLHVQYSRLLGRAGIVLSAGTDAKYEFIRDNPFYRALPVTIEGTEPPLEAKLVIIGDQSAADDFWLAKPDPYFA